MNTVRRLSYRGAAALLFAAGLALGQERGAPDEAAARGPNVLFISVDDLNCKLGCYGDELAATPAIDRLAARGVRFERAYCQYPLCNPSRISLLTGLRPARSGVADNGTRLREALPEAVTLPELFKRRGWFTARVGKVGHADDDAEDPRSWDATIAPQGRDEELRGELVNLTPRVRPRFGLTYLATDVAGEELVDGRTASAAIALMEERRAEPFFLAVGFLRPHVPFIAPSACFELYPPAEELELPLVPVDDLDDVPGLSLAQDQPNLIMPVRDVRRAIRGYRAATSFVDSQVGRLLAALERLELTDDTVVVLFSDHGYLLGEHGQWMKWSLFEPGARVPLVIAAPGFEAGECARTVELIDLFPTLADLCGLPAPAGLDGVSLRPLLEDPASVWPRPAFTQLERLGYSGWSVRTERWRYSEWAAGALGRELYDHDVDPLELHNLAELPDHAEIVRRLAALIAQQRPGD